MSDQAPLFPGAPEPELKPWQTPGHLSPEEARAAGMAQADLNAEPEWKDRADEAIREVASRAPFLTADDVWARLEANGIPAPHDPRALGPRLSRAAKRGVIESSGQIEKSRRAIAHGSFVTRWRSLIYAEQELSR